MLLHRLSPVLALAAVLALTAAPVTATAAPESDGKAAPVAATAGDPSETAALAALDQVQSIVDGAGDLQQRTPSGAAEAPADLTMALRELANLRVHLSGADRDAAEALLRRPTSGGGDGLLSYGGADVAKSCTPDLCVHYATEGRHEPTRAFVAQAKSALSRIHDTYLRAGYREPRPDGTRGGDARIDVYLGDIGDQGVYGYCTSDQPEPDPTPSTFDRYAYCVLDEDYQEFPTNTPVENLKVTAAHEYFHATQFAYDRYEDSWLLEATAAWVEDEMYDGVDDNVQYLASSQLARPGTPLDTFSQRTLFHYGTWSFFRFLTERYTAQKGGLPRLVLDVFRKADGARGGPDQYSWQAVNSVLRAKKTTGARMLGAYAVGNRRPAATYDEGRANRYRTAPLGLSRTLSPSRKGAAAAPRIDHLASWTARFTPSQLGRKAWKLRVRLDMAPTTRGSLALVTRVTKAGKVNTKRVRLNRQGNATTIVGFRSTRVRSVEVTLVNGSGRFTCFTRGAYSCQGKSKDDNLRQRLKVTAFR